MKKLLLILAVLASPVMANDINIQPDTGDIIETLPVGGVTIDRKVGNIMDMYSIESKLSADMKDMYHCSTAMASAGMAAKPVALEPGLALGVGLGGFSDCGAGAVALDYKVNESWSYNVHFTRSFKGTAGTDLVAGAGLHFRF